MEPTIRRYEAADVGLLEQLGSDSPVPGALPLISLETLVRSLTLVTGLGGSTHFVVGAAGQGKSRLAAEVAGWLLRNEHPCILMRRQELDRIFPKISTPDPKALIAMLAPLLGLQIQALDDSINDESLPVVIDGWNELELRYRSTPLYKALTEIISGTTAFPVLVTSRRVWWESSEDIPIGRDFYIYRLEHFGDDQRREFARNAGVDPEALSHWLTACGLSEVCRRPFFLEQAVSIYSEPYDRDANAPRSRADLMSQSLNMRYRQVKSAVYQGAYPQSWPKAEHLAVASALASISSDQELVDPQVVSTLLGVAFLDHVDFSEHNSRDLVQAFVNTYLLDHFRDEGRFAYPHQTLRDFGLALLWHTSLLPTFALVQEQFENVIGYWVGLQKDPNRAALQLLENPTVLAHPHVLADVLGANAATLNTEVLSRLWMALGQGLSGRRVVRDATVSDIRDLPTMLRRQALAFGVSTSTRKRWPGASTIIDQFILSPALSPDTWQSLTRIGQRWRQRTALIKPELIKDLLREGVCAELLKRIEGKSLIDAFAALIDLLGDSSVDTELRVGAVAALGELRIITAARTLRNYLDDSDARLRAASARALGLIGDVEAVPILEAMLADPDDEVLRRVLGALGRLGASRAARNIEQYLGNPSARIRATASRSLGWLLHRASTPFLIPLLEDKDEFVRGAVITALGRLGASEARTAIERCLSDENSQKRDPDPKNRSAAATALAIMGDRRAVPALLRALQEDEAPLVRGAAATALGLLGNDSDYHDTIIAALIRALEHPEPVACGAAITALGRLGAREAREKLETRLIDANSRIRGAAATALGLLGDPASADPLIDCLERTQNASAPTDRDVPRGRKRKFGDGIARSRVVRSVVKLGSGGRATGILEHIVRRDPSYINRTEAIGGLARLGALTSDIVSYLINPKTLGPLGNNSIDTDHNVRGRVCASVFLEFANGQAPEDAKLALVVQHLTDEATPITTINTALAAFDRLALTDVRRAVTYVETTIHGNHIKPSSRFNNLWKGVYDLVIFAERQERELAEWKENPLATFEHFVKPRKGAKSKLKETDPIGDFIVVAAKQELEAIRRFVKTSGMTHETSVPRAKGRPADIVHLSMKEGATNAVAVMLALQKGGSAMRDLLDAIDRHEQPKRIILVGMMAGIKGRVSLLDVIVPLTIYDGTVGTKDGAFVSEFNAGNVSPLFHAWLQSLDLEPLNIESMRLITHKKTVAVPAKIDDIKHEYAQELVNWDPENIVGLEMEAAAIAAKQMSELGQGVSIQRLMIKGVADYAGERPDPDEIQRLGNIPSIAAHLNNPDPTKNAGLKAALQEEATSRAFRVAMRLLEVAPIGSDP